MDQHMTAYDLGVVAVLALLAFRGFRVGLVATLLTWLALGVGLWLALRFDRVVGGWIARVHGFVPATQRVLAFLVIVVVVEVAAGWLAGRLGGALRHVPLLGGLDRLGGLVCGALLAVATVWLVTAALIALPSPLPPFSGSVRHSETVHLVRSLTPRWQGDLRTRLSRLRLGSV
jgi:uncharacterized membrane protein required for colicin V production